jgi:hypothetical protein
LVAKVEVGSANEGFNLRDLIDDIFLRALKLDLSCFDDRVESVEEGGGRFGVLMSGPFDRFELLEKEFGVFVTGKEGMSF